MNTPAAPPNSVSLPPFPFPVRRFSVAEYHRLGAAEILDEEDAVELLEGWISPKMIRTPLHDAVVALVEQALRQRLPSGWMTRVQSAITTANSEPEPDVALVRGAPRDYLQRHPAGDDLILVVEVADSSLARDRAKARIYATAGIAAHWIVNLNDDCVEVFTHPDPRGGYAKRIAYSRDQAVPLEIGDLLSTPIGGSELLP